MSDVDLKKLGASSAWRLGQVKWFGGYNNQKDRENNFGFISALVGNEIYVHRDALLNTTSLDENDIVLYTQVNGNNGKLCAKNVFAFKKDDLQIATVAIKYLTDSQESSSQRDEALKKYLLRVHNGAYGENVAVEFKSRIDNLALSIGFKEFILQHYLLVWVSSTTIDKYTDDHGLVDALAAGIPISLISTDMLSKQLTIIGVPHAIEHGINSDDMPKAIIDNYIQAVGIFNAIKLGVFISSISPETLYQQIKAHGVAIAIKNGINADVIPRGLINEYIKNVGVFEALDSGVKPKQISSNIYRELLSPADVIKAIKYNISLENIPQAIIDHCVQLIGIIAAVNAGIPMKHMSEDVIHQQLLRMGLPEAINNGVPIASVPARTIDGYVNDAGIINAYKAGIPPECVSASLLESQLELVGAFDALECGIPASFIPRVLIEKSVEIVGFSKILAHISPLYFRASFIDENIKGFKVWFNSVTSNPVDADPEKIESLTSSLIDHLSFSSILYLSFYNAMDISLVIAKRRDELDRLVKELYKGINCTAIAPFVWEAYHLLFPTKHDFARHPLVRDLFLKAQIKHKFYSKEFRPIKYDFFDWTVTKDPEVYILTKTIPLLRAQFPLEYIANTIFNEVWLALQNKRFDINNPSILSLFPSCDQMSELVGENESWIKLSCEAFYWKTETEYEVEENYNKFNATYSRKGKIRYQTPLTYKQIISTTNYNPNIFLCRSKRCFNPQFTPHLDRHFLDYSFYDWLAYYGYSYSSGNKPLKNDFAIKLAGYLNRVREIFSRLHCRECGVLMISNKNYAKTEMFVYDEYKNDFVMKQTHAAYRATVFHCNNPSCVQCGNNYYINHCLNYKCYEIIDSRDLAEQCSEGRYVCRCGSCCKYHAEKYGNVNNGETGQQKYKNIYKKENHLPEL
ncbi:cold shock domain-containing protein [Aeromonas salmonicida]|uniref:cold shock domain-containing protein n=1 Tax=Aeromonas salmonicida TaxID=645 RepID=UPI000F7AD40C|nr:cold shock domain-containing protein [Aeromonas salmonicida]RSM21612.1 hypothetical protein C5B77_23405 [Aeromonas salmonicida]